MSKRTHQPFQRLQRNPDDEGRESQSGVPTRTIRSGIADLDASLGGDGRDSNAQRLADLHIGLMRLSKSLGRMGRDNG